LHLHTGGSRGKGRAVFRLRALAEIEDTCALDVTERARASALRLPEREYQMTTKEIATMQGVTRQSVDQDLKRAIAKVRAILRIEKIDR
jgi:DNA-directed RNA polymerase specialized sigma24 family protein